MEYPLYRDFLEAREWLTNDGWLTPNTYSNYFAPIKNIPAVYLFLMVDRYLYEKAFVAYVGMSIKLKQRINSHLILREIQDDTHWVMTWFKPTSPEYLRNVESGLIRHFDPPWNINGRARGLRENIGGKYGSN